MPATPEERQEFGRRLRALRGPDRTIQAMVDQLRDEWGFRTNTSQFSGWERGEYAPKHRSIVSELDAAMRADGQLLEALGHLSDRDADFKAIGGPGFWADADLGDISQLLANVLVRLSVIEERIGIDGAEVIDEARDAAENWRPPARLRAVEDVDLMAADEGDVRKPPGKRQNRPSPKPEPEGP